ncbi:polysaccharide biosynthesis/export family protein [Hymenobacter oligotrophus]|uniref:polysaccharide biosynthesis/export family protein n=1 Tax=Hymenobacter oligotrophus TaxID=2319843 RepID=UPI001F08C385|nr:polysaccharide biosynthesis/export family protein [Hymenobacter oligotrophus]
MRLFFLFLLVACLGSCASSRAYKQNIMFRTSRGTQPDTARLRGALSQAESIYRIRPNNYLEVRVYTNQGERLIDPNGELGFGAPGGGVGANTGNNNRLNRLPATQGRGVQQGIGQGGAGTPASTDYLVYPDGAVVLPIVGRVAIAGLTVRQADSLLRIRYDEYYKGSFVQTRVTNNRVFVLGTPGGAVVPMLNENMNLLEVLALVGGVDGGFGGGGGGQFRGGGKAFNIRHIRPEPDGTLDRAQVSVIDLTTIEGMRRANLEVKPNDIVYIEPLRRPFFEALQDIGPILGLVTSITGFVTTLVLINNQN